MKQVIVILLVMLAFGASLYAEGKKIAVLHMEYQDRESKGIVRRLEDDMEDVFEDTGFELLDIGDSMEMFEDSGFKSPSAMELPQLVELGNKTGAEIVFWLTVQEYGKNQYKVIVTFLSLASENMKPVFIDNVTSNKRQRREKLKEEILPFLKEFSGGEAKKSFEIGVQQYNIGDLPQAKKMLLDVIKIDPGYLEAYIYLSLVTYNQEDYQETVSWANKGLEIDPANEDLLIQLSKAYTELGESDKRIDILVRLAEAKNEPKIWLNLGSAYAQNLDTELAIEAYEKAIELDPEFDKPYYRLALIYLDEENYEAALPYLQKAADFYPNNEDIAKKLAAAYKKSGKLEEAIEHLRGLAQENPEDAKTLKNLVSNLKAFASDQADQGNYDEALKHYQESIDVLKQLRGLEPESPSVFFLMASTYREMATLESNRGHSGKFDQYVNEAIKVLNDLKAITPDDVRIYNFLSVLYVTQGNNAKAESAAREAINADPESFEPYIVLYRVNYKNAVAAYNEYIDQLTYLNENELYGEEYDAALAKVRGLKEKSHNLFKQSLSWLNQALGKTDRPDQVSRVKEYRVSVNEFIAKTAPK